MPAERLFSVMGTSAHLMLVEPSCSRLGERWAEELLDRVQGSLMELEARWTRFDPRSELSRLNASPGVPVMVQRDTFDVLSTAVEGWAVTGGRFDPTVLEALERAGYDRDFPAISQRSSVSGPRLAPTTASSSLGSVSVSEVPETTVVPGPGHVTLDESLGAVTLPRGVTMDLGGIGKGRAADIAALEMMRSGARGACVDLGGDIRVTGEGPHGEPWGVTIEDPFGSDQPVETLWLTDGAVATSSSRRRRWSGAGGEMHHIIDPSTGLPADTGLVSVSVVAAEATWAEILSKAAFVSGPLRGERLISDLGAVGVLVATDGTVTRTAGLENFGG